MATYTFKNRSTPGVNITERGASSTPIVGVPTAVPAFIGYTQQAVIGGTSVLNQPIFITSMADYVAVFGGAPTPVYGFTAPASGATPDFTTGGQGYTLTLSSSPYNLYYSIELFFMNGGSTCYVVSVGDYAPATTSTDPQKANLVKGLNAIGNQIGPTMLVVPDAVNLGQADYQSVIQAMIDQCIDLQDRVAILDVWNSLSVTQLNANQPNNDGISNLENCISTFQQMITEGNFTSPSYGMAYFPFLNTSIVSPSDLNYSNFELSGNTSLPTILNSFNADQYPSTTSGGTAGDPTVATNIGYITSPPTTNPPTPLALNNLLVNGLTEYAQLLATVAAKIGQLPPSGAMAGLFALSDQNWGVWNAPANLSPAATNSPSVNLTDAQQGPLNIPINGVAVNVIRNFPGRGPLVWGARTLDGNSQDWRYIQVRRTLIYIEQSIKTTMQQYVFHANVAATWVQVTQSISGFLQGFWASGGLMGAKTSDAFTVQCGLGSTMTGDDVLNGYMIVAVQLQMVRPAEFIELTFQQLMPGS